MKTSAKLFFASATMAVGICSILLAGRVSASAAPAASADEQAVVQADHEFQDALTKKDSAAVGKLLDAKFAWTDTEGATHENMDALKMLDAMAADTQSDADLHTLFYGELGLISGIHHDARLMRIWVKRPAGWRLLIYLDTPIGKRAPGAGAARAAGGEEGGVGDCDNPCRTLPFKPETAADKAVITEWQKTKVDEWHPDIADWQTHIAGEFMIINNGSARNKPDRVKIGEEAQARGVGSPGAPILSMTMADFGNAVIMISHHVPYQGGKPYYNVRVF